MEISNTIIYIVLGVVGLIGIVFIALAVRNTLKNRPKKEEVISKKQDVLCLYKIPEKVTIVKRKWHHPRRWIQKYHEKKYPEKMVLVNMEFNNGHHKTFLVKESDGGFLYLDNKYVFDADSKYYHITTGYWCFDFHENYSLPIKRKIPITEVLKGIPNTRFSEIEYASNPMVLERWVNSKIIEALAKAGSLAQFFRQLRLFTVITMVGVIIHLLLFMQKSGMFEKVTGK